MDTHILLDCRSWGCLDRTRSAVIDILYQNQIFREVRAFDNDIFILGTSQGEHDVIAENLIIAVPTKRLKVISWGRKYGRQTHDK